MDKRYVMGFFFTPKGVVMIYTLKESWKQGLWNGVGGNVEEGESFLGAMAREFKEETGLDTERESWEVAAIISGVNIKGQNYRMMVYHNWFPVDIEDWKPFVSDEGIVDIVPFYTEPMDGTCKWLMLMCMDKHNHNIDIVLNPKGE